MANTQQDISQTLTFIKGLVTEQSALSGAVDSFSDGVNILIDQRGKAYRRQGIDYENGYGLINVLIDPQTVATSVGLWEGVNGDPNLNLIVLQLGTKLIFLDAALTAPSSQVYATSDFGGLCLDVAVAQSSRSQFAPLAGGLVMTNPGTDPLHFEYEEIDDIPTISIYRISLRVRDFIGISDGLKIDESPTTLSAAHHYNLKNQGWVSASDSAGTLDETETGSNTVGGGAEAQEPDLPVVPNWKLEEGL